MTDNIFSRQELPDDVNRWPSDPMALFGVTANSSRRDLKRAYSQLIRRFKPEHAPEQFRRLREAFEILDQQLEWRDLSDGLPSQLIERNGEPGANENPEQIRSPSASSDLQGNFHLPPENAFIEHRRHLMGADQLWQQALDGGDLETIYSELVALTLRERPSEIGFARLYWLFSIRPEFDPSCDPADWLIAGIRLHGTSNRLTRMLSLDVRRRLGQVPPVLADDFLSEIPASDMFIELATTRWFVARSATRFDIIKSDLDLLRRRFLDQSRIWQLLLFGAVRQLVMARCETTVSLLPVIRDELAHTSGDIQFSWTWDWYESTIELNQCWVSGSQHVSTDDINQIHYIGLDCGSASFPNKRVNHARSMIDRLGRLVETTWESATIHVRHDLLLLCSDLTNDAESGLNDLMAVAQVSRPLVRRLLELIEEQRVESVDSVVDDTPAVENELRRFVRGGLWDHSNWLSNVLNFCLKEAVTPSDVAASLEANNRGLPDTSLNLAELIRNHLPLACIVGAQRLLW